MTFKHASSSSCALLAQSHQRLSEGLRSLLQASFSEVFVVADRPSLIEGADKLQPTLLIVDLALAEGDLSLLLALLRERAPLAYVLLLSDYDDGDVDRAAVAAGADGIAHKSSLAADLVHAVDAALAPRRSFASPGAH